MTSSVSKWLIEHGPTGTLRSPSICHFLPSAEMYTTLEEKARNRLDDPVGSFGSMNTLLNEVRL